MKAHMLILPFDYSGLALDHEKDLVFPEHHWVCQMGLILETVTDFVNLLESRSYNRILLTDRLGILPVNHHRLDMHLINVRSIAHYSLDQLCIKHKDRAV